MPRFLSCGDVRVKSAFQSGILEAWEDSLRPMRVRKVSTSGTNGVGEGTGGAGIRACRRRV